MGPAGIQKRGKRPVFNKDADAVSLFCQSAFDGG